MFSFKALFFWLEVGWQLKPLLGQFIKGDFLRSWENFHDFANSAIQRLGWYNLTREWSYRSICTFFQVLSLQLKSMVRRWRYPFYITHFPALCSFRGGQSETFWIVNSWFVFYEIFEYCINVALTFGEGRLWNLYLRESHGISLFEDIPGCSETTIWTHIHVSFLSTIFVVK